MRNQNYKSIFIDREDRKKIFLQLFVECCIKSSQNLEIDQLENFLLNIFKELNIHYFDYNLLHEKIIYAVLSQKLEKLVHHLFLISPSIVLFILGNQLKEYVYRNIDDDIFTKYVKSAFPMNRLSIFDLTSVVYQKSKFDLFLTAIFISTPKTVFKEKLFDIQTEYSVSVINFKLNEINFNTFFSEIEKPMSLANLERIFLLMNIKRDILYYKLDIRSLDLIYLDSFKDLKNASSIKHVKNISKMHFLNQFHIEILRFSIFY